MSKQKNKMICPKCGAEMNHHADKLVYPTSAQEAEKMALALGGVIEETHCLSGLRRCGVALGGMILIYITQPWLDPSTLGSNSRSRMRAWGSAKD